ncbi:MAG: inosine/xanthosine triphosphatase [Pyrinomonadaceae bacterium]
MKIIIASTRAAKVEAARAAVARLATIDTRWRNAEIIAGTVETDAPAMPFSDDEMMRGARQRAKAMYEIWQREKETTTESDTHGVASSQAELHSDDKSNLHDELILSVGLEGGLHTFELDGARQTFLRGWACATDGARESFGVSASIIVPPFIVARVRNERRELGDVIDEVAGEIDVRSRQGAWGVLSKDLLTRAMSFEAALVAAFAPFYNDIYAVSS